MTYEQFWEGDSWLVKDYRKAQEYRRDETNFQAWLQGMYIYEAIADIAPILHPFAKKGTRARKYAERPYEFKKPDKKKSSVPEKDKEAKAQSDRILAKMMAAMNQSNAENAKKRIQAEQQMTSEAGKRLLEE
jgi:hypothetical protein